MNLKFLMVGLGLTVSFTAGAYFNSPSQYPYGKPSIGCVKIESQNRGIPLAVALAINSVERGKTGQAVQNTNNTQDLGAFQINSIHLPMIASKFGGTRADLMQKGCFNAHVAMYLLSQAINQPNKQHLDYYTRVSGYHSWTPHINAQYRRKLVTYVQQWNDWLRVNPV